MEPFFLFLLPNILKLLPTPPHFCPLRGRLRLRTSKDAIKLAKVDSFSLFFSQWAESASKSTLKWTCVRWPSDWRTACSRKSWHSSSPSVRMNTRPSWRKWAWVCEVTTPGKVLGTVSCMSDDHLFPLRCGTAGWKGLCWKERAGRKRCVLWRVRGKGVVLHVRFACLLRDSYRVLKWWRHKNDFSEIVCFIRLLRTTYLKKVRKQKSGSLVQQTAEIWVFEAQIASY